MFRERRRRVGPPFARASERGGGPWRVRQGSDTMTSLLRSRRWVVAVAWLWFVGGMAGAARVWGQGEAETLSASFRKASQRVLPAVVTVRAVGVGTAVEFEVPDPFGPPGGGRRFGRNFPPPGPFG